MTPSANARSDRHHPRAAARLALLIGLAAFSRSVFAQATNEIVTIAPDNAAQGTVALVVTFTLDNDMPPAPPAGVNPASVTLGTLIGTSVSHSSQYAVTATFAIPADEPVGPQSAAVTFNTPNGTIVFSQADAFTVTSGASAPPTITQHPGAASAAPLGAVTFTVTASGAAPLDYQWQKDAVDIPDATGAAYALDPVTFSSAGDYRCVVSNNFGTATSGAAALTVTARPAGAYPIVDTGQGACYDTSDYSTCPSAGQAFSGQDAQFAGAAPVYTLSADGLTVHDDVTGLTWQRSPDSDRDGDIDAADKYTFAEAQAYPAALNAEAFGGFTDWRLPTIKELYSLIDFRGTDPSGCDDFATCPFIVPFIDTDYFDFAYGDTSAGERIIDSQYASSTVYVAPTPSGTLLFGVNFADGRIKGYGLIIGGGDKTFFVICVRGGANYGVNNFIDLGDGTILDRATGLQWQQGDSGTGLDWQNALAYAENLNLGGHADWRLPNAKELQGLLDYTRSPDTTASAAIDPLFAATPITNEAGAIDYAYYWSATTHANWTELPGGAAAYVSFGRAMGYMDGFWQDVHGAGAQRSDPKSGDPADYPFGHGPQGDAIRIFNYARCVRGPFAATDLDRDGDVDLGDLAIFTACVTGPETIPARVCAPADFTGDGAVDLADYARFQRDHAGQE
ncbi:MAG TPA: DUF1566 domain-containing protein [Phycisphaerae bacterium]|nr:DUF1566 domain-containing protein [Phycisphaerae bacterium]